MNPVKKCAGAVHWFLGLMLIAAILSPGAGAAPPQLKFEPIDFHPEKGKRFTLANGMVVYLLEDHELPIVDMTLMVRAGSLYEPADKIGLASITGSLMRTGGAGDKTGDEIDEELEFLSASISTYVGVESGGGDLNVLAKDFDRGLDLFADILLHPRFSEEKLKLLKDESIEDIRRRNDNPSGIASREFAKLLYGADSPYAREDTVQTISAITRQDCIDYYTRYFHPDEAILGVTGDFKSDDVLRKLEYKFKEWEKRKDPLPQVPPVQLVFKPSVNVIDKNLTQTSIRVGQLGIKQDNPDYFALSVMNDILGGGAFSSRLFQEVRTRKGLAYSVGSIVVPGHSAEGMIFVHGQTMTRNTALAISAILDNLRKVREEPVTPEELQMAKDSFLNSFIFSFSTPAQIVSRQVSLDYFHLPADFMERYRSEVSKVTREDVLRVAKKYLHTDGLTILAVGQTAQFDPPLSQFGPVRVLSLSVP